MENLRILIKDLPNSLNAIYLDNGENSIICINSKLDKIQKICTLIHELIHHKYYPECNFYKCETYFDICNCNWIENKINKEVAKLLISDETLLTKVIPYLESYYLSELAEEINVTEDILKLRLNIFLDFITKN